MKKLWVYIIILILVVIALFMIYFNIMKFEDYREPKEDVIIDYSCNVNSDCTLKVIGEGICRSDKQRCVNKNSDSAILEENKNGVVCAAIEIPPSKCECVRNTCISYSCDYKDECDVMDSP